MNRVFSQLARSHQVLHRKRERNVAAGDGGGAGSSIGLQNIAVNGDGPLAQRGPVDDGSQAAADEPLDLHRSAGLFAANGFPEVAGMGRARQHAVLGCYPPLVASLEKRWNAFLHARRDQHPRAAELCQHGALRMDHEARNQSRRAHFVGLAPAGPERRFILH